MATQSIFKFSRDIFERRAIVPHFLVLIFLFASVVRCEAVFGQIDIDDRFPFVVKITTEYSSGNSWCSAVVKGGGLIVGTAAHCVINDKGERAKLITIEYIDAEGATQKTTAKQTFLPSKLPKRPDATDLLERDIQWSTFNRYDIALLVPARRIQTLGYAHWITDLLTEDENYKKPVDQHEDSIWHVLLAEANDDQSKIKWSEKARALAERRYRETFAHQAPALVVGFGGHCRQWPCDAMVDRQRRFAEVTTYQERNGVRAEPPWVWFVGSDDSGANPTRPGDSGGATFVRALDGRWIFVGYNSTANGATSQSSSLLDHVDLYARVSVEGEFPEEEDGIYAYVDKPDAWPRKQAVIFFDEVLEAWSLDNIAASMRLRKLYPSALDYYGDDNSDYFIAYEDKRSLFTRWPERRFERRRRQSPTVHCELTWKSVGCDVTALVDWKFKNSKTTMIGESEVKLRIQLEGLTQANLLENYGPKISSEGGRLLSSSGPPTEPTLDRTTCRRATGDWTMVNPIDEKHFLRSEFNLKHRPGEGEVFVGYIPSTAIGVEVSECSEKWCRAKYKCLDGWIEKHFVKELRMTYHRVVGVSAKDRNGLNIRNMPDATSDKVGSIPYNGQNIIVRACSLANWCFVTHNATSGWVSRRYIEPQEALAVP